MFRDSCVAGRCQHMPIEGCCLYDAECDDGDECTVDLCEAGQCVHQDDASAPGCGGGCVPNGAPSNYPVAPGGGVLPWVGGQPAELPAWMDFQHVSIFGEGDFLGVTISLGAALPEQVEPANGGEQFADISLVLFAPGMPGAGGEEHPPLAGATHMLSLGYVDDAVGWSGHLWRWQNGWVPVDTAVNVQVNGAEVFLAAQVPGADACAPFKVVTQWLRQGANDQPELVWKMFTGAGNDPNGPPVGATFN